MPHVSAAPWPEVKPPARQLPTPTFMASDSPGHHRAGTDLAWGTSTCSETPAPLQ